MTTALEQLAGSIRAIADRSARDLVHRRAFVEATLLAAVAQEHVLVIGPPGTAKSQAVRQIAEAVGDRYFEYLIGKFTEPGELFGAVDLVELRAGRVVVDTTDMLPEARLAFLDEVFLGSSAILNTLLGILNERIYRRGATVRNCPLRICVGASNSLPTDPTLAAFADRFLVRVFIDAVPDASPDDLLEHGWANSRPPTPADTDSAGGGVLDVAAAYVDRVDMVAVRPALAHGVRICASRASLSPTDASSDRNGSSRRPRCSTGGWSRPPPTCGRSSSWRRAWRSSPPPKTRCTTCSPIRATASPSPRRRMPRTARRYAPRA